MITAGAYVAAAVLSVAVAPRSLGQAAPAATPAAEPAANEDEVVVLSPFVVSATDANSGYTVKDTLAGTRVRTELRDLGTAISVYNAQFMQDTGVKNAQDLLVYTTNTEVGGLGGNFAGMGNTNAMSERTASLRPNSNTRVRGLDSADNTRDYFLTEVPWDGYNVDRVDLQRGANSILFGVGSPAGIVNTSVNGAAFTNAGKFENRISRYGSMRNSFDYNWCPLDQELAIKVTALDDHTKYRQRPAFNRDQRLYSALRYDPKFLAKNGMTTSFKFNIEWGDVKANRPRTLPPFDSITPWFYTGNDYQGRANLNKATFNPYYAWQYGIQQNDINLNTDDGSYAGGYQSDSYFGVTPVAGNPQYYGNGRDYATEPTRNNWIANSFMGRLYNSDVAMYYTANSSSPVLVQQPMVAARFGIGSNGQIDQSISGIPFARPIGIVGFNQYAVNAGLPGAAMNVWKDVSLTDSSVFDFYNNLIDGTNKNEWQRWTAWNASVTQTAFQNRLALDVSFFHQSYFEGQQALLDNNQYAIGVDANQWYLDMDEVNARNAATGAAITYGVTNGYDGRVYSVPVNSNLYNGTANNATRNSYAGYAYVGTSAQNGNFSNRINRDSLRMTLTGELRGEDLFGKGIWSRIFGRHIFTGIYSRDQKLTDARSWVRWAMGTDWADATGQSRLISDGSRQIDWINYLSSDNGFARSSASGWGLSRIQGSLAPASEISVRYFDSHWNKPTDPSAAGYVNPSAPWTNSMMEIHPTEQTSTQAENPANYVGWTTKAFKVLSSDNGDIEQLYTDGSKKRETIYSNGATWQGYILDGCIVPIAGWRKDRMSMVSNSAIKDLYNTNHALDTGVASMDYDLTADTGMASMATSTGGNAGAYVNREDVSFESKSWGIVTHLPKSWRAKLWGTDISLFYNKSENARAETRVDIEGHSLPNSTGNTRDYGFSVSTLADRLSFKVNWYTTKVKDATLQGDPATAALGNNTYFLYLLEYWGAGRAKSNLVHIANYNAGNTGYDNDWAWRWTDLANEQASCQDWINTMPSQEFYDNYMMSIDVAAVKTAGSTYAQCFPAYSTVDPTISLGTLQAGDRGRIRGMFPVATSDNESKGVELELSAQPLKGWNLSFNASKTTAARYNLSKALTYWIEKTYARYNGGTFDGVTYSGMAGNILQWGGDPGAPGANGFNNNTGNFRTIFNQNIWAAYQVQQQLSGSEVAETRPWRFNVINNYSFSSGFLKGVNVGAAYRWQKGQILGFGQKLKEGATEYTIANFTNEVDVTKKFIGDSEDAIDLWVGYGKKLTEKVDWRIQLNLKNVGDHSKLVPISVNPDGSWAACKIQEGLSWSLTNTFSF